MKRFKAPPLRKHKRCASLNFGQMSQSKIILFLFLFGFSLTANGQSKINPKDSIDIKNQIEGFYTWYFKLINDNRLNQDFNPGFIKRKDGMTELDFSGYKDGLRKYKFSEDFIQRKILEYRQCNDNLSKIPFDKFSKFEDLNDFESINCDFTNRYEWTGGMESKETALLSNLTFVDDKTILGHVNFTSYARPDGEATVTFKKIGKKWMADNFKLGR
jgi:hypothetical protein